MSRNTSQWMPIYWGDYHKDTGHLSTLEHGAYFLLIGHYWATGKPLVDNDETLSRICRLSMKEWRRVRPALAGLFKIKDSDWHHTRIDKELTKQALGYEKRRNAAQASNAKQGKTGHNASRNASPSEDTMRTQLEPEPEPDKSSDEDLKNKCSPRVRAQSPRQKAMPKETAHLEASFELFWLGYPRKERKGRARKSYISALQNGAKHEEIIAGLERFSAAKPWGSPEYIPHPSSWLNDERWRDDYQAAGPGAFAEGSHGGPRRNGNAGSGGSKPESYFEITERLIAETENKRTI